MILIVAQNVVTSLSRDDREIRWPVLIMFCKQTVCQQSCFYSCLPLYGLLYIQAYKYTTARQIDCILNRFYMDYELGMPIVWVCNLSTQHLLN